MTIHEKIVRLDDEITTGAKKAMLRAGLPEALAEHICDGISARLAAYGHVVAVRDDPHDFTAVALERQGDGGSWRACAIGPSSESVFGKLARVDLFAVSKGLATREIDSRMFADHPGVEFAPDAESLVAENMPTGGDAVCVTGVDGGEYRLRRVRVGPFSDEFKRLIDESVVALVEAVRDK